MYVLSRCRGIKCGISMVLNSKCRDMCGFGVVMDISSSTRQLDT